FTFLEASLPSLISKLAPIRRKGTAMGIYSTTQFIGIFVGGSVGGLIYQHLNIESIFLFSAVLSLLWLLAAISMREPPYLKTLILKIMDKNLEELRLQLQ